MLYIINMIITVPKSFTTDIMLSSKQRVRRTKPRVRILGVGMFSPCPCGFPLGPLQIHEVRLIVDTDISLHFFFTLATCLGV